jgi:hypothetical protein
MGFPLSAAWVPLEPFGVAASVVAGQPLSFQPDRILILTSQQGVWMLPLDTTSAIRRSDN